MASIEERPKAPPIVPVEKTMLSWDGVELFYRAWLPEQKADRAVILFHRGHEHSGRLADVVAGLHLDDVAAFAWDARGHGRSPGERGYAPSFGCMVRDVDCFVRHVSQTYGIPYGNIVVVAHSVGAVTVATWVHDYAPPIRALALATPALRVKLYVPLAIPALRLMQWFKRGKKSFITSYVKAKMLTHDAEQAARYDGDPLIAKTIAVNILLGLHDAATRLIDDAGAIRVPTLLLAGNADWVVKLSAEDRFFDRLGSPAKRMRVFNGMYHDILHEKDRELVWEELRRFIREAFERPASLPSLLSADEHGFTYREYEQLGRQLPWLSPRRWYWALSRLVLNTGGRLSRGIRIGWQTGFDSGKSLDHIYENRAQGWLGIGRLIDWFYLNGPGWTGIRQRKIHLQRLLKQAIGRVRESGEPVRILDVATGCGRYVLDTLAELRGQPISALLRDWTPANLQLGKQIAARLGLTNVTFEPGDAFDRRSLANVQPAPNVAIVSGLYELFPSNTQVLESLRGIADAMQPGGYLIYTGQPWHPQIELIARVLPNRDGQPWVMRRRTQEELDQIVAAAGFEKIAMEIDEMGIFTVSLARRVGHLT
ncbi:MAG TPA: bifunctional alpha/beta hydrolase/class I SAM-dependent methyltransferase [Pirellulales bacterium]|nr:bifunctional alpha/beta hydrolase/class I SAM-dependent methyltransferase [Pirellulales bacterium]